MPVCSIDCIVKYINKSLLIARTIICLSLMLQLCTLHNTNSENDAGLRDFLT